MNNPNSNHVTKIKAGEKMVNTEHGPRKRPITITLFNAGKTDREIDCEAAILKALLKDNGQVDTKSRIENGEINLRGATLYAVETFTAPPTPESTIELLREDKNPKIGVYSLIGNTLKKFENMALDGILITIDTGDNSWTESFNYNSGLINSQLVLEQKGKILLEMPLSQLVLRSYTGTNFLKLSKILTLLESDPINLKLKVGAGRFPESFKFKVEFTGFKTY